MPGSFLGRLVGGTVLGGTEPGSYDSLPAFQVVMKILFLAPQPFFQERGTPIAVRLAIRVLAERNNIPGLSNSDQIDLLTYHEGTDIEIPGVTLHRIWAPRWLKNIGPGISFKKLLCDIIFTFAAIRLVWRSRRSQYALLHAVEESVFIALFVKVFFGIPYIYDMDSSMSLQLTEKWFLLRPLRAPLEFLERLAVRHSMAVVPVCDALAVIAARHGSPDTHILRDVSLLKLSEDQLEVSDLRSERSLPSNSVVILYIGNLEFYQGVDLLLESFANVASRFPAAHLMIIGGREEHIVRYQDKAARLKVEDQTHLIGPRPVSHLGDYLLQADILASPRTLGNNTPMKIYSYLHSGRSIIATDLPTHTQVLTPKVSLLAPPEVPAFAKGLEKLLSDQTLREQLGNEARILAEREYTFEVFQARLNELYDRVSEKLIPLAA